MDDFAQIKDLDNTSSPPALSSPNQARNLALFSFLRSFDGADFCLTAAGYIRTVRHIADPLRFGRRISPRVSRGKRHSYADSCPVFDSRDPHENRILMIAFPAPKKIS